MLADWPHAGMVADPSLEELEDWLCRARIEGAHPEYHEPLAKDMPAQVFGHLGYRAAACRCGRVFIRARDVAETTCGRQGCG